jgi:hypothetical protein
VHDFDEGWQMRKRKHIIHAAGRVFVEAVCTSSLSLVTLASVRFAILTEVAKHVKRIMKI